VPDCSPPATAWGRIPLRPLALLAQEQKPHVRGGEARGGGGLGLDRLLKAMDEGKVQLVTSELTLQEIEKYQDPMQQPRVKRIFRLLQKVPIVRGMSLSACTATATRALGSILP
jgi:hypothetical protein